MRIDLTQAATSQLTSETNAEQVKARQAADSPATEHEDRTTFSVHTQPLSSLVDAAMSSPEVRQDKVDNLKAAVASGSYKLDPGEIAASMIDELA